MAKDERRLISLIHDNPRLVFSRRPLCVTFSLRAYLRRARQKKDDEIQHFHTRRRFSLLLPLFLGIFFHASVPLIRLDRDKSQFNSPGTDN